MEDDYYDFEQKKEPMQMKVSKEEKTLTEDFKVKEDQIKREKETIDMDNAFLEEDGADNHS